MFLLSACASGLPPRATLHAQIPANDVGANRVQDHAGPAAPIGAAALADDTGSQRLPHFPTETAVPVGAGGAASDLPLGDNRPQESGR